MTSAAPPPAAFSFPPTHSFPPFYTLQPNSSTRHAQLTTWAGLVLSYCRHRRLFRLSLSDALESELFYHRTLERRLSLEHAREVVQFMAGEGLAEWVDGKPGKDVAWIWWRRAEEWASVLEHWVSFLMVTVTLAPTAVY